ncbi:MAG: hypothetical protein ACT4QA_15495 [Panacagrimonas sp.]
MQTVTLPDAVIDTAKRITGKSRTPEAVREAISIAESVTVETPGQRLRRTASALRDDVRRKHPNGMTQARITRFIRQVRSEVAARGA